MGTVAQLFDAAAPPRFAPEDLRIAEAMLFAAAEPTRRGDDRRAAVATAPTSAR